MSTIEWVLRNGEKIQVEWWDKNDLATHLNIDL